MRINYLYRPGQLLCSQFGRGGAFAWQMTERVRRHLCLIAWSRIIQRCSFETSESIRRRGMSNLYSVSRVVYLLVLICLMFCFRPSFIIVLQVIDCVFCVDNMIGMSDTTNIRLKTSNPLRNHTLIHCAVPTYLKVLLNCDSMHRNVCLCLFDNSVMNIFYLIT